MTFVTEGQMCNWHVCSETNAHTCCVCGHNDKERQAKRYKVEVPMWGYDMKIL
jgi:hypothetical protein